MLVGIKLKHWLLVQRLTSREFVSADAAWGVNTSVGSMRHLRNLPPAISARIVRPRR
jgi:hypothetical protein